MAIISEYLLINGRRFTRSYSDQNRFLVRDDVEYSEAYDPTELDRRYTEGEPISDDMDPQTPPNSD